MLITDFEDQSSRKYFTQATNGVHIAQRDMQQLPNAKLQGSLEHHASGKEWKNIYGMEGERKERERERAHTIIAECARAASCLWHIKP